MNLFNIAWKSIKQRSLSSLLTTLSVALGVALVTIVLVVHTAIADTFRQTGSGYNLIIGPKGSELQLVLSAIYHIDNPIENLPWRYLEVVQKDYRVEAAIPLAFGDSTEEGSFPVVGTTPQFFMLDYVTGKKFQIPKEHNFLRGTWDAVIGAEVARRNGWGVGSKLKLVHAGQTDHVHDEEFTVQGVLLPTGTANDRVVFIHLDGFFLISGHDKPIGEAIKREAEFFQETEEQVRERYKADLEAMEAEKHEETEGEGGHHHHHHGISDLQKEFTAILVRMKGESTQRAMAAITMSADLKEGFKVQAVNPVAVMRRFLDSFIGNIQNILLFLTSVIILVSMVGVFVSIYNTMSERRKEIATMRALGAQRTTVFGVILLESILLCVTGAILGLVMGHGLMFVVAPIIEAQSGGLMIDATRFVWVEAVIVPALVVLASLFGFLPALNAYRTDVAKALAS